MSVPQIGENVNKATGWSPTTVGMAFGRVQAFAITFGIIFELSHAGGWVEMQQSVAKLATDRAELFGLRLGKPRKNQRKEGGKFPAQFTPVAKTELSQ